MQMHGFTGRLRWPTAPCGGLSRSVASKPIEWQGHGVREERERDRQRDRDRETETETDRQTDRETERETERDRQTERVGCVRE